MSKQQVITEDALAKAAIAEVASGMVVGLGAGSTSARGIQALAERVKAEGLDIECVGACHTAETLGRALGLKVVPFAKLEEIDWLIDGADEVDRDLRVMKGTRGAVTRERMLAWASKHTVYMVGADKVSKRLGTKSPVAIAVMYFGLASTRKALRMLGVNGVLRRDMKNEPFLTDDGNLILDVTLDGTENIDELAAALNDIPGVVDHGLFVCEADRVLIEHADGKIECLDRS